VTTPFLTGLLTQISRAQRNKKTLRFVLMFTGNGQLPGHWLPKGGERDFKLSPVLQPLKSHRKKLLLLHGLQGKDGHSGGMSESLTGWPARTGDGVAEKGPSIDQFLAARFRGSTPLPSLELGVFPANEANDQTSYSASGLPVPAIGSPRGAFDRLFGVTNGNGPSAKRMRSQQASVLDHTAKELQSIHRQLGSEARLLLDEQLTLVRAKEKALAKPFVASPCDPPAAPTSRMGLKATWKAQHDNIVGAFRCGVTRVATLRAGGWGGIESGKYDEIGVSSGHHEAAHAGPGDHLLKINVFHAEQFAYLLSQLDSTAEGEGTMLDSTVAIWINELGLGDFNHHSRSDVHVVLAGGKRAGMRNGSFLKIPGTDYQDFLFSLIRLMGMSDVAKFGDHGSKVIAEMFG
jgi:hypothetical protein